ncbi:tetratricopeptide repeat protein, partial [bacterium]|nr:tetratricopeptide repeat protein [bacterium]
MDSTNLIIIVVAFVVAIAAIYVLYSIILFQGGTSKGDDLQLTTKNVLDQVEVLYSKKEYALVELLATKYLDRVPGHTEVRLYLAKAFYKDKKYNQSIKHCEIILKKSNSIETHEVLGKCYMQKGWLNKAIQEFELIYDYRKNDKKTVRRLAELYRDTDQLYMAIAAYEALSELMEQEDDIAEIQSIIAELCEEVRDFPAAFEAYKRRLAIYPTDVETNKKLAELYIKISNYPVAIETLLFMLSFVEDAKTQLWIYDNIVDLYVETGEYEKAIDYSERMLELQ